MKRLLITLLVATPAALTTINATADQIYHPPGPSLVYGPVSNNQSLTSNASNPAAGAMGYTPGDGQYNFGVLSSFGFGVEIGDVDNLFDQIDQTATRLETATSNSGAFDSYTDTTAVNDIVNGVNTALTDTNDLLSLVEENGYAKAFTTIHLPIMPIVITNDLLGGSLSFDANGSVMARIGVKHDPLPTFNITDLTTDINTVIAGGNGTSASTNGNFLISNNNNNIEFALIDNTSDNDSTAILRASYVGEVSLGYSREIWNSKDGKLFTGLRGKYYQVELRQDVERFFETATNGALNSENAFDNVTDADRLNQTGIGIDFGAIWMSSNYHLGATLTNINEPEFEYNFLDPAALNYNDATFIDSLNANRAFVMESQLKLEGAFYSENKRWVLGAALDANEIKDPVADEYKWAVVSGAYISDSFLIPSFRAGYRKNMVGSNLSYITAGMTWFKVNLDVAYSPDTVDVDGSSVTRSFIFNMGLNLTF